MIAFRSNLIAATLIMFAATMRAGTITDGRDAERLLREAIQKYSRVAGLTATWVEESNAARMEMKEFRRNDPDRGVLLRIECVGFGKQKGKTKTPVKSVYIIDERGTWQLIGKFAARIPIYTGPGTIRPIPIFLSTAHALGVGKGDTLFEVAHSVRYRDRECTRITATLSDEMIVRLRKVQSSSYGSGTAATEVKDQANRFPAKRVYYIEEDTGFLVAMESYTAAGEKLINFSYDRLVSAIPDSGLFTIPPDYVRVDVKTPAELKQLLPSTPDPR